MSSKEEKESEEVVKCTNCRQDIEAKKMFLHEGFCHRNNVFCTHCEKVFLKTDYEKHKKKILKEKKNKKIKTEKIKENKHSPKKVSEKKEKEKEKEIAAVIKQAPIEDNPKPSEYPRIPIVEEYKINAPIIISENGQILSNKNKNEYILPYLGFDPIQNNEYNLGLNSETIMNIEKQSVEEIQNMLYRNNKFNQNVIINRNLNMPLNENNNNINFYNINNQINNINDINNVDQNIYNNTNSNFNHIYSNADNKKEYNHFIIYKNNPETVNNSKKIKFNNYKKDIYTPEKESFSQVTNDSSYKKSIKAPLDQSGTKKSKKKEPTDSKSKSDIRSKESLALTKSSSNNYRSIKNGKKVNLINHLKYNYNKKNNKNEKNQFTDENIMNQNTEEFGIDENQKEILQRDFIPLTHSISFNDNEKINSKGSMKKQITSESILQDSQKSSIKKKLFSSKEKNNKNLVITQEVNNGKKIDLKVKVNPKRVNRYGEEI